MMRGALKLQQGLPLSWLWDQAPRSALMPLLANLSYCASCPKKRRRVAFAVGGLFIAHLIRPVDIAISLARRRTN